MTRTRWCLFWLSTIAVGATAGAGWAYLATRFVEVQTVIEEGGVRG